MYPTQRHIETAVLNVLILEECLDPEDSVQPQFLLMQEGLKTQSELQFPLLPWAHVGSREGSQLS